MDYHLAKEAEAALLSSLIIRPEQFLIINDIVTADSFYNSQNKLIYTAIKQLNTNDEPVTTLSIIKEIEKHGQIINHADVVKISSVLPTGELAEYYANIVQAQAMRRNTAHILKVNLDAIEKPGADVKTIVGNLITTFDNLETDRSRKPASVYPEIVDVWESYFDLEDNVKPNWVPTGFLDLDRSVCLADGTHTIIGASPAEGKTSLVTCIARNVSATGRRVLFFTLEQTRGRMLQKIISQEAKINHKRFITGRLTEEEKNKISHCAIKWSNPNMCVLDTSKGGWSVSDIRIRAKKEKSKDGLDLLIVDLLNLLERPDTLPKDAREHIIVNENARQLEKLAMELNIPVISTAHLNREKHKRTDGRPILTDLREAGEQYADIVIFLHNEFNRTNDTKYEGIIELLIAKNRDGATGSIELGWHGESTLFYNIEKKHKKEPTVWAGGLQD